MLYINVSTFVYVIKRFKKLHKFSYVFANNKWVTKL